MKHTRICTAASATLLLCPHRGLLGRLGDLRRLVARAAPGEPADPGRHLPHRRSGRRAGKPRLHDQGRRRHPAGAARQRLRGASSRLDQQASLKPLLAKSWDRLAGPPTYTFDPRRQRATSPTAQPFTAKDAVYSIDQVKNAWTVSLKRGHGRRPGREGAQPTPSCSVTLEQAEQRLALHGWPPGSARCMTEKETSSLATKPVGTGPYVFDQWRRGDSIRLKANPSYWEEAGLPAGDPQVLQGPDRPQQRAPDQDDQRHRDGPGPRVARPVPGQRRLRDRRGLDERRGAPVDEQRQGALQQREGPPGRPATPSTTRPCSTPLWAGHGSSSARMVPPTDPWYEDLTGLYPHDVAKAKALVAETNAVATPVRLRIPSLPYAVSCGQVVKSQLEQAGFT